MIAGTTKITIKSAALIAGFSLLITVMAAPFSELFVYPKIVVVNNAQQTISNITSNKLFFAACIFGYLITFILDIVIAWALFILLSPVNKNLSLLTPLVSSDLCHCDFGCVA